MKYVIIPDCYDENRGDQALVWETINVIREAGFTGDYYMMSDPQKSVQSKSKGIKVFKPILQHPSRFFKKKNNIQYGLSIKVKWGIVAIFDLIVSASLLVPGLSLITQNLINKDKRESYKLLKSCNAVFVKGGGFIHSYGDVTAFYYMYMCLYTIILAQSLGKKVYILPNSYGPFRGFMVKPMVKSVLNKCELVTSRESISSNTLKKELAIESSVFYDLGFYLSKDSDYDAVSEMKKLGVPIGERKCVAITVRPYRFPEAKNSKQKYNEYKEAMVRFVRWLREKEYFPVFIEQVYNENEHEQDLKCINEINDMMDEKEKVVIYSNRNIDCSKLKTVYSLFDFIVGTRFHSIIFSLASNIPAIAITYGGNKGQGIMRDIGLSEYALDIYQVKEDAIINKFTLLEMKLDDVKEILNRNNNLRLDSRNNLIEQIKLRK